MKSSRSHKRVVGLVTILCGLVLAAVPSAEAKVGPRVTIGVFGDSVVEGYTIPHFLRDSLVPQLAAGLAHTGNFELGATGLIPASVFRWRFSKYTVPGKQNTRPDAWVLAGFATGTGGDGPSGYSAIATSSQVTATAPINGPFVAILFTKFAGSGVFTVTAGAQTFAIDARSSGPPTPTEQWITVAPGTRVITVHGPSTGSLIFDGAIVRAPVSPGRIGVEVENLGHMGHRLVEDSAPRILDSLRLQRFDISVFLDAYIWMYAASAGGNKLEIGYANALRSRAALARSYGGMCLIVDASPVPLAPSLIARFAAIDRQIAGEEGCAYFRGLAHLWNASTASQTGITLVDSVHPRAPGYRLIANALVPELARLVRERVRTRGF